jgi:aspartyl protease family protein
MSKAWIAGIIILVNSLAAWAESPQIVVVGLFNDQAVVEIDQKQRILKVGQASPEGVTLISADSEIAVLEIAGVQQEYRLGAHIGSHYAAPVEQPEVSIWPTNGMYLTTGSINGFSVDFLVDTGASGIALNGATARRLGLDYLRGRVIGVQTASGYEKAYQVTLDMVQIGDIKLYNVGGIVIDGIEPRRALLGMTFLGQLDIQHNGERMDLKKKF